MFLNNLFFTNIVAIKGAGVAIVDVATYIYGCRFTYNTAIQGGGLYFLAQNTNKSVLVMNSSFEYNNA